MKILRRSATSGGFPPLWCLTAPPFPRKRWHYKAPLCCEPLMKGLLCRALLSHRSAGGRWWRQPPRGACISDTRRAVVWFSPPKAAFILAPPRAPTSPAQRYYITPEGESPQPACKAKPITGRTLAAQGQRPGGWLNPHARKGVSTFGKTGKHRLSPGPGPDPDRAERRLNPQAPKGRQPSHRRVLSIKL